MLRKCLFRCDEGSRTRNEEEGAPNGSDSVPQHHSNNVLKGDKQQWPRGTRLTNWERLKLKLCTVYNGTIINVFEDCVVFAYACTVRSRRLRTRVQSLVGSSVFLANFETPLTTSFILCPSFGRLKHHYRARGSAFQAAVESDAGRMNMVDGIGLAPKLPNLAQMRPR
jgi:hypothetical protein